MRWFIRYVVREFSNTFRVLRSMVIHYRAGDPLPEVSHLTYSYRQAISQVNVNREINALTKKRHFEHRVVIVAGLPKSGSSVIGECASTIHSHGRRKSHGQYFNFGSIDLYPELAGRFRRAGGVQKEHIRATSNNLSVLEFLGVKYLVVMRHPADQVVATYCHLLGTKDGPVLEPMTDDGYFEGNFYPVHGSYVEPDVSMTSTLHHMMCEGYLKVTLTWMVNWLRLRNREKSLVVRFEDFMTNRTGTLGEMSQFLRTVDLDEQTLMECNSVADVRPNLDATRNLRQYPNGWTGEVGVWKKYFSAENKTEYLVTVADFIDSHPDSSLLTELYPNLLDIDSL